MDLKQTENILAIATEKSISRAADKLFLTQSALNQQLLKLEKELGMPLFKREKHMMVPTEAGNIYLDGCRQLLEVRDNTYKKLHDISDVNSGTISIGYSPERGAAMFTEIYPVFHLLFPKVRFQTREYRNRRVIQALASREIDLAAMIYLKNSQNSRFSYISQVEEEIILGVPATHPLSYLAGSDSFEKLPEIDLTLFQEDGFIVASPETISSSVENEIFRTAGFQPRVLYESSGTVSRINAVKAQYACAFFPQFYVDRHAPIVYFSVRPHIKWVTAVAYRKDSYLSVPELVLVDLIRKYNLRVKNFEMQKAGNEMKR